MLEESSSVVNKYQEEQKSDGPKNGSNLAYGSASLSENEAYLKPQFNYIFRSLICEMKNIDEAQAERALTLSKLIFNPKKSSGASTSIIRSLQQVDFLLEYLLMTLLFLLQNRQSDKLIRTSLQVLASLTSQMALNSMITSFLANLL
jgi:hypothetical protein